MSDQFHSTSSQSGYYINAEFRTADGGIASALFTSTHQSSADAIAWVAGQLGARGNVVVSLSAESAVDRHLRLHASSASSAAAKRQPTNVRTWLIGALSSGLRIGGSDVLLARVEEHDDLSATCHVLHGSDRCEVRFTPEATIARRGR